mgnify:CR=1 FL=1
MFLLLLSAYWKTVIRIFSLCFYEISLARQFFRVAESACVTNRKPGWLG